MRSAVASAVLMLLAGTARADDALEQARQAYASLDYERVLPLLKKALEAHDDPKEAAEIYALMAYVHVAYGRIGQAQQAFREVLKRDPEYQVPGDASPKVRTAFEYVKAQLAVEVRQPESSPATSPPPQAPSRGAANLLGRSEPSWYEHWWLWAGVSGAILLGAAGAFVYGAEHPREPAHDAGPVRLK